MSHATGLKPLQGRVAQRSRLLFLADWQGLFNATIILTLMDDTCRPNHDRALPYCLNLTGQFQLSNMAAQLSEFELGLKILLGVDVSAWDSPKITVNAGKIGQIS